MSCNCGNTFRQFLPSSARPKVKVIKKDNKEQEPKGEKEEEKKDEGLL